MIVEDYNNNQPEDQINTSYVEKEIRHGIVTSLVLFALIAVVAYFMR
jgi:hypothetical protein